MMRIWKLSGYFGLSIACHVTAIHGLSRLTSESRTSLPPMEVTLVERPHEVPKQEIRPEEPAVLPPPETTPERQPVPPPEPAEARQPDPSADPDPARATTAEPPPDDATSLEPIDLSGVTLTAADGEGGWATAAGNGRTLDRSGPSGESRPKAERVRIAPVVSRPTTNRAAPVVPLANLSRRPAPPALAATLERQYPKAAKREGREGEARLRVRIDADGHVRHTELVKASAPEFGSACQRAVTGSTWSAPLDQNGKPVATWVNYSCHFRVEN